MRQSKISRYEMPYIVKGGIQCAGAKEKSKGIYVRIKLSERGKPGNGGSCLAIEVLQGKILTGSKCL